MFSSPSGRDLKTSILSFVQTNKITAGCVASVVGCLSHLSLRLADSVSVIDKAQPYEIINVSGTITPHHLHLHLSAADSSGHMLGGHMLEGCVVSYTAEVCILVFDQFEFDREYDPATGYSELTVKRTE
ncbi:PPC domain-containing DNA-binding protein [Veronia pacifica]|uniref:DNA-binding protein n=1 Tax=Veronia pacifica TaxID=1080227 RepID=A0A1C3EBQ1_9GAMM|nr:PPC domain-containing DNA-binding protein [Veronia pacifica]ODA30671.1 DNA-binding protein [Veronia pacifica]